MSKFSGSRLKLARERNMFLGKELAGRCEKAPQTISNWETESTSPSPENVKRLSVETGFPEGFFYAPDAEDLQEGAVSFRARSRLASKQKRAALAAGMMATELADWIECRFNLPPVSLPDFSRQSPELVAEVVRTEWMIGEKPIPNMIQLLESRGVLVFTLAQNCAELDAFSFWSSRKRPIVLLNTMKSSERSRMDAAHELMHLLCRHEETRRQEEEEANHFAGALLMPKGEVYKYIRRSFGLRQLIEIKRRWGVALSALVYRIHALKLISDWQYRMLFIELSKRGFRINEPKPIPREGSTLLSQVFDSLRSTHVRIRDIASDLNWNRRHLEELIFGLGATLLPIEGGGKGTSSHERPKLRVVR